MVCAGLARAYLTTRRFGSWRPYIAAVSFKPVLAAGLAVVGLYLAGTLSGALLEDELAPPKMSDRISDRTEFGTWTEVLPNPPPGGHERSAHSNSRYSGGPVGSSPQPAPPQ